ncbi:MAG TPA: flagellar protein FlgN [Pseudobdellovibrionaceae bacterium]|nr:flagellar protein FlgN [Pseudobdellovibrionaceae bacterium]
MSENKDNLLNSRTDVLFDRLVHDLDEIIKVYRQLLDIVRQEKELLVAADREGLEESNSHKELMLQKLRLAETLRAKHATELAQQIGADDESPRLLEIASKFDLARGDKLRGFHSVLDVLVRRISDLNKENAEYAEAALKTLHGAMGNVKDTLGGKKTYEKKGQFKPGPHQSGNFVSKEV